MKRFFVLAIMVLVAGCSGTPAPAVTPTYLPPRFIETATLPIEITSTPFAGTGSPPPTVTHTPTLTRTATATRTPTVSAPTSTPRPPTITAVGTSRARTTPNTTPDCGIYDCMGAGLPNLPILDSPTPWGTPSGGDGDNQTVAPYLSPTYEATTGAETLIALQITPIIVNGTEVDGGALYTPVHQEDLEALDDMRNQITPVLNASGTPSFGLEGDTFGNGGNGFGFNGDGGNVISFDNPNTTIWIAYAKGLFDNNVNLFGPFSALVALVMTFLSLQFILIVANLFIPVIAIVVGLLRKIVQTIADITPL